MYLINYSSIPYTQGRERGWSQWCMQVTHLPLNTNWPRLRWKALLINGPHGFCVATYSGIYLINYLLIPYTWGRERGWSQWHMHVTYVPLNTNWPHLRRTVSPINGPHGLSSATYSGICLIKYASITYTRANERGQSQWCMYIAYQPLNTNWPYLRRIVPPINGPHGLSSATYVILIIHWSHTHREEREGGANGACALPVYPSTQTDLVWEEQPHPSTGHMDFV